MLKKLARKSQLIRNILQKQGSFSYPELIRLGLVERPHYAHCVFNSALLAKKLDYKSISILEVGCAGGNGLVNLEYQAREVAKLTGLNIEIYGFDTGKGLPAPLDYRDLMYFWKENQFEMDVEKLRSRLEITKLVLGNVKDTSRSFYEKFNPSPIASIMFDLDYYSSTIDAFQLFDADDKFGSFGLIMLS